MAILITGGLGYIGINTAVELLQNNKNIILIDLPSSSPLIDLLNKKFKNKFKYYSLNLLNKNELEKVFYDNPNINTIIHCASYKMATQDMDITKYYQNNITTTLNLLEFAKKSNIKNFIFNSSANVYEKCDITEEQLECTELKLPDNIYGQSKVFIERILKDFSFNSNTKITILRLFNPIGIHPFFDKNFGYEILKKSNNLSTNIASVVTGKKDKLEIFNNTDNLDNRFVRDYISIVDLVNLYNYLIDNESKLKSFNIYNIGSGNGYSILDFINIFEEISNKKVNYTITKTDNHIIPTSVANIDKIKKDLNWIPHENLKITCENILKYFI